MWGVECSDGNLYCLLEGGGAGRQGFWAHELVVRTSTAAQQILSSKSCMICGTLTSSPRILLPKGILDPLRVMPGTSPRSHAYCHPPPHTPSCFAKYVYQHCCKRRNTAVFFLSCADCPDRSWCHLSLYSLQTHIITVGCASLSRFRHFLSLEPVCLP